MKDSTQYVYNLLFIIQEITQFLEKENKILVTESIKKINSWMQEEGINKKQILLKSYLNLMIEIDSNDFLNNIPDNLRKKFFYKLQELKESIKNNLNILTGAMLATGMVLEAMHHTRTKKANQVITYDPSGVQKKKTIGQSITATL